MGFSTGVLAWCYHIRYCNETQMPLEITVAKKRNTAMVFVSFTKMIYDAFCFMLCIHTTIILSLIPSIVFFYSSSLAE